MHQSISMEIQLKYEKIKLHFAKWLISLGKKIYISTILLISCVLISVAAGHSGTFNGSCSISIKKKGSSKQSHLNCFLRVALEAFTPAIRAVLSRSLSAHDITSDHSY